MKTALALMSLAASAVIAGTAWAAPADGLLAADKACSQLSVEKGSNAAFLAYMSGDARIFGGGNEPPIYGNAEAMKRFQTSGNGDPKTNILRWEPDFATPSADGTQGFTDGRWFFDSGGGKIHISGHYLTVWKKDASGQWKIAANMATTDPQMEKKP